MKKKSMFIRFLFVLCVVVAVVLYLPSNQITVTPQQKEELATYIGKVNELNTQRAKILHDYEETVIDVEKVTESYRNLEEIILPQFIDYQKETKKLKPTDPNIQEVHTLYLLAGDTQNKSFNSYVEAYRNQQEDAFQQANTYLEESNKHYEAFDLRLRELAKNYDIPLPSKR